MFKNMKITNGSPSQYGFRAREVRALQAQATGQGRGPQAGGRGRGRPGAGPPLPKNKGLQRAIAHLWNYKNTAFVAYGALFVATLAQLGVPQLLQNLINSIVNGFLAQSLLKISDTKVFGVSPQDLA